MIVRMKTIAKFALCAAAIAGPLPWLEPAGATQAQLAPHIFTPHCAAPRPNCRVNLCARRGRCSIGETTDHGGCLYYYFCRQKAH